ncbi:hypothetical protein [Acinetobacter sp.]|uniref:hypothetical protein n=1 Tax=Acinetobacter sp. TaxID=472 RepID=UPI003D0301AE
MNKLLKINKIALGFVGFSLIGTHVLAEPLTDFETQMVKRYDQIRFTDRYEIEAVNQEVASKITAFIEQNPQSFAYDFKKLTSKNMVFVNYSPDRKLKFYTFDISSGGTMREFESYVQFKQGNKVVTQAVNDGGFIRSIQHTELNKVPTYFISSTYIGSSCVGAYDIQAAQIRNAKYQAADVFKTRTQTMNHIDVDYDCNYYPKHIQPFDMNRHYIRVANDLKNIDILVIKPSGELTSSYLRYQKTKNHYQYIGIVK